MCNTPVVFMLVIVCKQNKTSLDNVKLHLLPKMKCALAPVNVYVVGVMYVAVEGEEGRNVAPSPPAAAYLEWAGSAGDPVARLRVSLASLHSTGDPTANMAGSKVSGQCACLFIVILFTFADALLSGLYIDNGDQTMIHHAMTRHERLVVEHEILDLLGLGERPRRARAPPLERSAPSFLLDVYKQLAEDHEQARPTRSSEMALSGDEQQAIDESDLIMTFQSKSKTIIFILILRSLLLR
jgi:hypothetical protein